MRTVDMSQSKFSIIQTSLANINCRIGQFFRGTGKAVWNITERINQKNLRKLKMGKVAERSAVFASDSTRFISIIR